MGAPGAGGVPHFLGERRATDHVVIEGIVEQRAAARSVLPIARNIGGRVGQVACPLGGGDDQFDASVYGHIAVEQAQWFGNRAGQPYQGSCASRSVSPLIERREMSRRVERLARRTGQTQTTLSIGAGKLAARQILSRSFTAALFPDFELRERMSLTHCITGL